MASPRPRRRARILLIVGAGALAIAIAAVTVAAILGSQSTRAAGPSQSPSPVVTATSAATPSASVTAAPTPTTPPAEAGPTDNELIQECVALTEENFTGVRGEALTIHVDQAIVGERPDGTHGIYVPVTDESPHLAESEHSMACILTDDFANHGSIATPRFTDEEIAQLLDGTGPEYFQGGD